jgi:hypothetical protein
MSTATSVNTEAIKPLPADFKSGGFAFHIIQRTGKVVLLSKRSPHMSRETFEVVLVRSMPAKVFPGGRRVEAREAMPPSESWGTSAWSCVDLKAGQMLFRGLCHREQGCPQLGTPPVKGKSKSKKGVITPKTPPVAQIGVSKNQPEQVAP